MRTAVKIKRNNFSLVSYDKSQLEREYELIRSVILTISKAANQFPEKYVDRWLELSDTCLILYKDELPVAFSLAAVLVIDRVLYFPATMVSEKYQKSGIASYLWKALIKLYVRRLVSSQNFFRPLYLIFRTQNPRLYEILKEKIIIYPKINEKNNLNEEERSLIISSANILWPKKKIELENLIIKDAYKESPDLVFEPEKIDWAEDKLVNEFFEKRLKIKERGMDAFLIFGKIRFRGVLKFVR